MFFEIPALDFPGSFRSFLVGWGFSWFESGVGSGSPSSMSESMRFESDEAVFDFDGLFESEATVFDFGIAQYVAAGRWNLDGLFDFTWRK